MTHSTNVHQGTWTQKFSPETLPSGLPAWAFILVGAVAPAVLLLSGPIQMVPLALIWGAYLYFVFAEPERAILMFLCAVPIVAMGQPGNVKLLSGLNAATIFFLTISLATHTSRAHQDSAPQKNPLVAPTVFILLLFTASAIVAYGTGSAQQASPERGWYPVDFVYIFSRLKNQILFILLGPMAFRLVWNVKQLRHAAYCISIFCATIAVEALSHRSRELLVEESAKKLFVRATGMVFDEPNVLGGFMAVIVVILIPLAVARHNSLAQRITFGTGAALGLCALVYSFSRGAWIAALAAVIVWGVLRGAKGLIIMTIMAMTATIWVPQPVLDRIDHSINESEEVGLGATTETDSSTDGRIERWKKIPGMWADAPILGHGFLSFPRVHGVRNGFGSGTGAHSSIAQICVEQGLIGLIAYFMALGVPALIAFRIRTRTDDPFIEASASAVVCGICCLFFLDISGPRFFNMMTVTPLWVMAGGVARMAANLELASSESGRPDPRKFRSEKWLRPSTERADSVIRPIR